MTLKLHALPDKYLTHKALVTAAIAGLKLETAVNAGNADRVVGRIQVLETSQGCVFSSAAICRYLASIRRDLGLNGHTLIQTASIDSWTEFVTHELEVPLYTWVYSSSGVAAVTADVLAKAKEDTKEALRVLDNHLGNTTYMVGHQFTLADICLACALAGPFRTVLDGEVRGCFKNLVRWFDLCLAQPQFAAVLGTEVAAPSEPSGPSAGAAAKGSPKGSPAAAKTPEKAKEPAAKKEQKQGNKEDKKNKGKDKKEEAPKELTAEELEAVRKAQLKKVKKEGGKRGVEIEGAADMGGLGYFCTSVDEPQGDLEMAEVCMAAMNEKSDPTEEERKGGSGHIGKMIFSAGTEQLAIIAYVPEEKQAEVNAIEWMQRVVDLFQGELAQGSNPGLAKGFITADTNVNKFPLKMKEPCITEGITYLKQKGVFPDKDDDSDDDYVFGDDDFPS